jgi:transcriptional regulator with XRE-family HTH domain
MEDRRGTLRTVMRKTGITQMALSRLSGVHQPSISQFLSGKIDMSDEMLDRLLSCMGYRLEVIRRPVLAELTRSERRSWQLHRQFATHLSDSTLDSWRPSIARNLSRLRGSVRGQPHRRNLARWRTLLDTSDLPGLRRVMTGVDRDSIQMREVSPLSGLLPADERAAVLRRAG